jgi:hypothetical protein
MHKGHYYILCDYHKYVIEAVDKHNYDAVNTIDL